MGERERESMIICTPDFGFTTMSCHLNDKEALIVTKGSRNSTVNLLHTLLLEEDLMPPIKEFMVQQTQKNDNRTFLFSLFLLR